MCNTRNFYVSTRLFLCAQDMFNLGFCVSVYSLNNWTRIDCVGFIWGRYIDTWTVYFFPWRWKHLSIALLRPLIITQLCIKQVRSFCHCCSMNNTINKWGLYAIFPQVFLGCLMSPPPPLFVHCIGGILLSELACSSARNLISSTPAVHFNTANKFVPSFVWTRIFL